MGNGGYLCLLRHAGHTCGVDTDVGLTDATRTFSINEDDLNNIIINDSPGAFMIHEDRGKPNEHVQGHSTVWIKKES